MVVVGVVAVVVVDVVVDAMSVVVVVVAVVGAVVVAVVVVAVEAVVVVVDADTDGTVTAGIVVVFVVAEEGVVVRGTVVAVLLPGSVSEKVASVRASVVSEVEVLVATDEAEGDTVVVGEDCPARRIFGIQAQTPDTAATNTKTATATGSHRRKVYVGVEMTLLLLSGIIQAGQKRAESRRDAPQRGQDFIFDYPSVSKSFSNSSSLISMMDNCLQMPYITMLSKGSLTYRGA